MSLRDLGPWGNRGTLLLNGIRTWGMKIENKCLENLQPTFRCPTLENASHEPWVSQVMGGCAGCGAWHVVQAKPVLLSSSSTMFGKSHRFPSHMVKPLMKDHRPLFKNNWYLIFVFLVVPLKSIEIVHRNLNDVWLILTQKIHHENPDPSPDLRRSKQW